MSLVILTFTFYDYQLYRKVILQNVSDADITKYLMSYNN